MFMLADSYHVGLLYTDTRSAGRYRLVIILSMENKHVCSTVSTGEIFCQDVNIPVDHYHHYYYFRYLFLFCL